MDYAKDWSARAVRDFRSLLDYVDEHNPFATERVREKILHALDLLQSYPRLGFLFQQTPEGEVRTIAAGSYRIFYIVSDETLSIRIMGIQHVKWADPDFS